MNLPYSVKYDLVLISFKVLKLSETKSEIIIPKAEQNSETHTARQMIIKGVFTRNEKYSHML